jgi:methionyl-tRNA formyltransferase
MKVLIASCRVWVKDLIQRLENDLDAEAIHLITAKEELNVAFLEQLKPDYIFFPHWSYLIPEEVYEQFNCVIFHMTDVPFGRGGSPLQNLIAREVYETKISALRCVKELDAGPVYLKKPLSLYGDAQEIYYRANNIMVEMMIEIASNKLAPQPQQGEARVFKRRTSQESNIAELTNLEKVFDYIRMLDADGYPKAFLEFGNFRLEFSRASFKGDKIIADVEIKEKMHE